MIGDALIGEAQLGGEGGREEREGERETGGGKKKGGAEGGMDGGIRERSHVSANTALEPKWLTPPARVWRPRPGRATRRRRLALRMDLVRKADGMSEQLGGAVDCCSSGIVKDGAGRMYFRMLFESREGEPRLRGSGATSVALNFVLRGG